MTIIAAYSDDNTICIGSDSCGISPNLKFKYGSKIISFKNYYLGFSNSYRVKDIIKECKSLPKSINNYNDLALFRDELRKEIIIKTGAEEEDNGEKAEESHPIRLILISKLGIHEIQSDYAILKPTENFTAIGAGKEFAIGSLNTHKLYSADAETAIRETLKTTIKYCTDCGGRIYIKTIKK